MPTAKPRLTTRIVSSLNYLLADLPLTKHVGTKKEPGITYLSALVKYHRSPEAVKKRKKLVEKAKLSTIKREQR